MFFFWKEVEAAVLLRQSFLRKEASSTLLSSSEHAAVTEASATKKSVSVLSIKGTFPTNEKLCSSYARAVFMIDAYFKQAPDGKAKHAQDDKFFQ